MEGAMPWKKRGFNVLYHASHPMGKPTVSGAVIMNN